MLELFCSFLLLYSVVPKLLLQRNILFPFLIMFKSLDLYDSLYHNICFFVLLFSF